MNIHCLSEMLIKKGYWSESVLSLKDSAYFTDWYSYKCSTEISETDFDLNYT